MDEEARRRWNEQVAKAFPKPDVSAAENKVIEKELALQAIGGTALTAAVSELIEAHLALAQAKADLALHELRLDRRD